MMMHIRITLLCLLALCASAAQGAGRVFYDGADSGNLSAWNGVSNRGSCSAVTTAADGLTGPLVGNYMIRCNTSVGDVYEAQSIPPFSMNNEVLYRFHIRLDTNHDRTGGDPRGSPAKKLRMFYWTGNSSTYNDNYDVADGSTGGMRNEGLVDGTAWGTYYGDATGDHTQESNSGWHTVELYWNKSNGNHKVWHDNVLVLNVTLGSIQGHVGEGGEMELQSNWEDTHDATNYTYFDEIEVFTDTGSGLASGTLAGGDAVQGGGGADTTPPAVTNPLPSGEQSYGTTSVAMQVTTNETATCKYGSSDVAYASLPSTFSTTGGTAHSQTLSGLTNGAAYTRYVRCIDSAGNANTSSTVVSFSVASAPVSLPMNECSSPPAGTIFCNDFDTGVTTDAQRRAQWDDFDGATDVTFPADVGPSGNASNHVALFAIPANTDGGVDLVKVLASTHQKLYLRYFTKYAVGFPFSMNNHGGGLTAGSRDYLGSSGYRPGDAANPIGGAEWASFLTQHTSSLNPVAGRPFVYSYNVGMYQDCATGGNCFGDSYPCIYDSGGTYCTVVKDRAATITPITAGAWHCVEQTVDMGTAGVSNGTLTLSVDGTVIGALTAMRFRNQSGTLLQNLWLGINTGSGGGTHAAVDQRLDNIIVSTAPIGCVAAASGVPPNVTSVSCTPTLNQAPATTNCTASATGDTPITWAWSGQGTNCSWSNAAVQSPTLTCSFGGGRAPCAQATNAYGSHQLCMATNGVVWRYVKPTGLGAN
jgi:hypothetical protein